MRKVITITLVFLLLLSMNIPTLAATLSNEESVRISTGLKHREQTFEGVDTKQVVHTLVIDTKDPFTQIQLANKEGFHSLETTSNLALQSHKETNQVIGSINASFFNPTGPGPVNLVVQNNEIVYPGLFNLNYSSPTNAFVAFGIDKHGKPKIADYQFTATVKVDGQVFTFNKFNQERKDDDAVFYMSPYSSTGANKWGTEIVITPAVSVTNTSQLGQTVQGQVSKVTGIGEGGNATVPENGFVISAHGEEWATKLASIQPNDEVEVTLQLNEVWQDAQYLIGSGPRLVKDGQVAISMDETASFARARAPRTAIAINKTGDIVYFVTVDGRQSGYSTGMTIREFAEYLKSIGAYQALNLDGGGSTTMVARQLGQFQPTVINRPSDGFERKILTALQAISTAPTSAPQTIKVTEPAGKIIKGTAVTFDVKYMLDQYLNPVHFSKENIAYEVTGGLGQFTGNTLTTQTAGTGKVIVTYDGARGEVPVTVVDTFDQLKVNVNEVLLAKNQSIKLSAKPVDKAGETLVYDPSLLSWKVEGDIGTVSTDGIFTAGDKKAEGYIVATLGKVSTRIPVKIAPDPVIFEGFDVLGNWKVDAARSSATLQAADGNDPIRQGASSVKLSYDFTVGETGIKAAYAVANPAKPIPGRPLELGLWVFGDGNAHWLRGVLIDGNGKSHTVDFTEEGGLDWYGWKYVKTQIPADLPLPIKVERVYVAEAIADKQDKGTIFFDQMQAVYAADYVEPLFKDMKNDHWAMGAIQNLKNQNIISGFLDGTFRPNDKITRAQAAVMLTRELNLSLANRPELTSKDVPSTHYAYPAIKAVAAVGIMNGKSVDVFAPNDPLTRAEMAVILQRAYSLQAEAAASFKDVKVDFWAANAIQALKANGITGGYPDGTYRPNNPTTRAEFSAFMNRVILKK